MTETVSIMADTIPEDSLSFNKLMELANTDPEGLERYRQQQVQMLIDDAPEYLRHRLKGLQFQIDAQRQIHKKPLGLCIKLSQMMHESYNQLHDVLCQFGDSEASITKTDSAETTPEANAAKILPFPDKRNCALTS